MKDTILLLFGFGAGVVVTAAFGHKVLNFIVGLLEKSAAKMQGK
jgi:hypothetical protein